MRIPVLTGVIKRRLLVNYRADADAVRRVLPAPFRPKLHDGQAIVGICLIRLEHERPSFLPEVFGLASENAAHRFAVEWEGEDGATKSGVFIPRRDTSSLLTRLVGGRLFPGEMHGAEFLMRDQGGHIDLSVESADSQVQVHVVGDEADTLPESSVFASVEESSAFFESGNLGFSATCEPGRFDGLTLRTVNWRVTPVAVSEVRSTYFEDSDHFSKGSIEFDHALVMRDIHHQWIEAETLRGS